MTMGISAIIFGVLLLFLMLKPSFSGKPVIRIMIKHRDDHVSLDTPTNRLYLSHHDPPLALYKYSDYTLRNEKGDKCVAEGTSEVLTLSGASGACSQTFTYSNTDETYKYKLFEFFLCWERYGTEIKETLCATKPYGFKEVVIPEAMLTPSLSVSQASSSYYAPNLTSTLDGLSAKSAHRTSQSPVSRPLTSKVVISQATLTPSPSVSPTISSTPIATTATSQYDSTPAMAHTITAIHSSTTNVEFLEATTKTLLPSLLTPQNKSKPSQTTTSYNGLSPATNPKITASYSMKTSAIEQTPTPSLPLSSPALPDNFNFTYASTPGSTNNVPIILKTIVPSKSTVIQSLTTTANVTKPSVPTNLFLAKAGQQCESFCKGIGKFCSNKIKTGNSDLAFVANGVACKDHPDKNWKNAHDPAFYMRTKRCAGYIDVNATVACVVKGFSDTNVRRLCKCVQFVDEDRYSLWSNWSPCSVSCNGGTRTRTRFCDADVCSGKTTETSVCNEQPCAIHGGFSAWSTWSTCTVECGGGQRTKTRKCNNPAPQHGGYDCYGDTMKRDICNVHMCPVHGNWTEWTHWSACDKPCNTGMFRRWRYCKNPAPLFGGKDCVGTGMQSIACNTKKCPAEKISVQNLTIEKAWNRSMALNGSVAFNEFYNDLEINRKQPRRHSEHLLQRA